MYNFIEKIEFRSELLTFLYKYHNQIVNKLKQTNHINNDILPFHLEDSVWSHTLLAMDYNIYNKNSSKYDILSALLHDFGKIFTQQIVEKLNTCKNTKSEEFSFRGHGPAGVQLATDFICDFLKYKNNKQIYSFEKICFILAALSNHIEFFNVDIFDKYKFCNYNMDFFNISMNMLKSDICGNIIHIEFNDKRYNKIKNILPLNNKYDKKNIIINNNDQIKITLVCSLCNKNNNKNIINVFNEFLLNDNIDPNLIYSKIKNEILNKIQNNEKNIIIYGPFSSRKMRKKLINYILNINILKKYNIIFDCIYIFSTMKKIEKSVNIFKNKKTTPCIFDRPQLLNYQVVPNLYFENYFHNIKYILNF